MNYTRVAIYKTIRISFSLLILLASVNSFLDAQVKNQSVQEIINAVNIDSITTTIQELTGLKDVIIDGRTLKIQTRSLGAPGRFDALRYLTQRLQALGLSVTQQSFPTTVIPGMNLIGEQAGGVPETRKYILCAHYDSRPFYPIAFAPGADDNASGVATVIEVARILSHYATRNSIVYALWDLEEKDTDGSNAYAANAFAAHEPIAGVYNMDMIGWDHNNDGKCDIHMVDTAQSRQLADTIVFTNKAYLIGLNPVIYDPGILNSDHREFINLGYSAVLFMEDYETDFNPHYHSTNDSLAYINISYLHKNAKLAAGVMAQLGDIQGVTAIRKLPGDHPEKYTLWQNYPNPFNPSTTISFSLPSKSFVMLKIFDVMGREVATVVSEELQAGNYSRRWNASQLPSGVYFYRLQAGAYTETKRLLLLR